MSNATAFTPEQCKMRDELNHLADLQDEAEAAGDYEERDRIERRWFLLLAQLVDTLTGKEAA